MLHGQLHTLLSLGHVEGVKAHASVFELHLLNTGWQLRTRPWRLRKRPVRLTVAVLETNRWLLNALNRANSHRPHFETKKI